MFRNAISPREAMMAHEGFHAGTATGFAGATKVILSIMLFTISARNPVYSDEVAGNEALAIPREITFDRFVTLRIRPPCTLYSHGSKLTIVPQNIKFDEFLEAVEWPSDVPNFVMALRPQDPESLIYCFDMLAGFSFKKEVVVRFERTTMIVTTEGVLAVGKDCEMPEVLEKGGATPLLDE